MAKDTISSHLSPELAAIASHELNETPATRKQCLADLKLQTSAEHSDEFLLRFLRCKKFNVPRALQVYEGYLSYRRDNPELFEDLSVERVRHVWEAGVIGALPGRDNKGRAVMVAFPGRWDPEAHSLEDVLRAMILELEYLIQSQETQITGIVMVADFTDFSLYQVRCIRPWFFQMQSSLVQNAFPARFKGVYILNQPWYISAIMAVVSRLLSEKMNSRIHMLGADYNKLSEHFDTKNLPAELGGTAPIYDPSQWIDTISDHTHHHPPTLTTSTTHTIHANGTTS